MNFDIGIRLLRELSDGKFHSGQQLAESMGVSRTAIWKHVRQLTQLHTLEISSVRGRGYRLAQPLELLDANVISSQLSSAHHAYIADLHLLISTESTNRTAMDDLPRVSQRAKVWLAETQTAGRGRRGRTWVSSFSGNLYLSFAWRFDLPMAELAGLSLVVGVAVAEALSQIGLSGHALKWPNDILLDGKKLGGILIEIAGEPAGPTTAVIGIGINIHLPASAATAVEQPWVDLSAGFASSISRNRLAGILIDKLVDICLTFGNERLAPYLSRWTAFDPFVGQTVELLRGEQRLRGIYRGISKSGGLLLESATGVAEHHAGEVSLRPLNI